MRFIFFMTALSFLLTPVIWAQQTEQITVYGRSITFHLNPISEIRNGYEVQSNGSPQQLWYDTGHPGYLHAVFNNSQQPAAFTDRKCLYFGSTDDGDSWIALGGVPDSGLAGYPSISGTSQGAAVIADHNNSNATEVRSKLYIDSAHFADNFTEYDPSGGPNDTSRIIWPRVVVDHQDNIFIASSQIDGSPDGFYINFFDNGTKTFRGWENIDGDQMEAYAFGVSEEGKVGLAWLGQDLTDNAGDVFYSETSDEGITWTQALKIFDRPDGQDTAEGALRGISLSFSGEEPCVVFDVSLQDYVNGGNFPDHPNEIYFWSPAINGGIPKSIADSSNVPVFPGYGLCLDYYAPLCKPVIGRSQSGNFLFAAFSAAIDSFISVPGVGNQSYFSGYFTYSSDGGESWTRPEKFTPDVPLSDWQYISIAPVNPVEGNLCRVHMVLQSDTLPGFNGCFFGITTISAQYYHAAAEINLTGINEQSAVAYGFRISQNYPNPFNPVTNIEYSIPNIISTGGGNPLVTLRVYDALGREVAVLVNEEEPSGNYSVQFDGSRLSSGVYYYRMKAGDFSITKKLILLK